MGSSPTTGTTWCLFHFVFVFFFEGERYGFVEKVRKSGIALLPFLVFIVTYLGTGIFYQLNGDRMAFYRMPSVTAMLFSVVVAFLMSKGKLSERFATFTKGAANSDIFTMLMVYLLAGAFASVASAMGAKNAIVDLGLSIIPPPIVTVGFFCCFSVFWDCHRYFNGDNFCFGAYCCWNL